ncbi:MAG: RNA methyltransferase [Acidiferrobacter sp.]
MSLANIRIVLVRPQHAGNIGGVARAMKNMGLSALTLVAPLAFPAPEATARAAGADDILQTAAVVGDLRAALQDCRLVMATSARARTIRWPAASPDEAAARLWSAAQRAPVAILFGGERSGLTNADLDHADTLVHIPVDPAFPSLNLAAAVQILCYEVRRHAVPGTSRVADHVPATQAEFGRFIDHLEATLVALGFLNTAHPRKLMRRLVRLFRRATPDQNEINILRGILSAIGGTEGDGRRPPNT